MAKAAAAGLPVGLARGIASYDAGAARKLVAARAAAVHAYAIAAGVHEDARPVFVLEVLGSARGALRVDRRLLATARALSETDERRAHRRAARGFRAACSAPVPAAITRDAGLARALGLGTPLAGLPGGAQTQGWVPAALGAAARARAGARPPAGPADWLPAALHGVNGTTLPLARREVS
jgi:hypothetical protein